MGDDKEFLNFDIKFKQWSFALRDVILVVLLALVLLLFITFAALYGVQKTENEAVSSKLVASSSSGPHCTEEDCLRTSSRIKKLLNSSVDPCEDFFNYACGGYDVLQPLDPDVDEMTIQQEVYQQNEERLRLILSTGQLPKDLEKSSSERKLKEYYTSCLDEFARDQLRGAPFIKKVIPLLGGSYLIDTDWQASKWDFEKTLRNVQTDLFVDALFAPRPEFEDKTESSLVMAIWPGGHGKFMGYSDYKTVNATDKQIKLQNDYKNFMRTVAGLVARDANIGKSQGLTARIEVFIDDVFTVESDIGKFASNSRYQQKAFEEDQKMTLDQLKEKTGSGVDWTSQMSYLFNEAGVTGSTKVVIPYPTYLTNITAMIRGLDPDTKNRMLHNYLTWRVLDIYINDLSGEYRHANRQLFVDKYGYANFMGNAKYCFYLAVNSFKEAVGALYVREHFEEKNKDKVKDMAEEVKTSVEAMLSQTPWMDQSTRDYAVAKMKGATYELGYPDFMKDSTRVDALYEQVTMNSTDFFKNMLAMNQHHRRFWNRILKDGLYQSAWTFFRPYNTFLGTHLGWDQVIIPAGVMQFPLYTYEMPHHYVFGTLGTFIGHIILHLIDEQGRRYSKGGKRMEEKKGWWSDETMQEYNVTRQCVADLYSNTTLGPFIVEDGESKTVDVDGEQYADEAMAITSGIRIAFNAYQSWMQKQKYKQDLSLPGLPYSWQRFFFLGHAQIFCYNRDPIYAYQYSRSWKMTEDTRVNVPLQELPEFKKAFGCKATDKMVSKQPCTYF